MQSRTIRFASLAFFAASAAFASADARADVTGVNMGAPVWHGVVAEDDLQAAIGSGAPYVRVNFRLDDWSSPADATLHGGKSWFDVYDHVVDAITSQGLEVYGLLNDEITTGFDRPYDSSAFEDAYAANAAAVIDRYKDRVRVWETINEPNDWAGGSSARMPADVFARVHARLYDEVKGKHAGDACWDVSLVTGPLFSFDGNPSSDYLSAAIGAGRAGGTWAALRASLGRDPIDGVGYHIYVAQGEAASNADAVAAASSNLDAIAGVLSADGIAAKIWVSEIGWEVDPAYVGEATQAARLVNSWDALGARGDVASLQWFTLQDFPGGPFGLYRLSGTTPADARPSYASFVTEAKSHAPQLAGKLTIDLPASVVVGGKIVAHVTATNLGLDAWSASANDRLGAASGCPSAWATNDWTWDDPGAANGYVKSATDARVFFSAGASIAQGATTTFDVALTAPAAPGKKRFAVRMVREGVAWFGATAWKDVDVVAPGADAAADASSVDASTHDGADGAADAGKDAYAADANGDDAAVAANDGASSGCGCRTSKGSRARGASSLLLLVAAAMMRRRR